MGSSLPLIPGSGTPWGLCHVYGAALPLAYQVEEVGAAHHGLLVSHVVWGSEKSFMWGTTPQQEWPIAQRVSSLNVDYQAPPPPPPPPSGGMVQQIGATNWGATFTRFSAWFWVQHFPIAFLLQELVGGGGGQWLRPRTEHCTFG